MLSWLDVNLVCRPSSLISNGAPVEGTINSLVSAVSSGQLDALKRVPEIQTELLDDGMSNAEALRTMDRLSLDAMPVLKMRDKSLLAIAYSDGIIRQMLITLVTRH